MTNFQILSPKRGASSRSGWHGFFPYYAGFSDRFADALLASANLGAGEVVWDPWNGSGTTTYAASALGLNAAGGDINAVMVIVARARLLPVSEADSLVPVAMRVVAAASRSRKKAGFDDPLMQWFDQHTASIIRNIDRVIRLHLIGRETVTLGANTCLSKMSGLAASLYVCLFSVCRTELSQLRSSNPTWYRQRLKSTDVVRVDRGDIFDAFIGLITSMRDELVKGDSLLTYERGSVQLALGDTTKTASFVGKAGFVLTSPPYCTRIDYTASTRIELAIVGPWLGINATDLSRAMIGTTRVPKDQPPPSRVWGHTCISFLKKVRDHSSKASRSYYLKNHLDYFDKMARSLSVVSNGMKTEAVAAFVVQDSFYKDIHNPLPVIISEMACLVGLKQFDQSDFSPSKSMSGINTSSSVYRDHKHPIESVMLFKRKL